MNRRVVFVIIMFTSFTIGACEPQQIIKHEDTKGVQTASSQSTITATKLDAGAPAPVATTALTSSVAVGVTRHLPGTVITTATGKYVYLVRSNGTVSPFATTALATASGYAASMILVVTVDELYCYGRGDQITTALPAPSGGMLPDGVIVKEDGRSTVYVISDGVAWPVVNEATFKAAGYNYDTLIKLAAGTLSAKTAAVGSCVNDIACLDSNYLYSCAQDDSIITINPVVTPSATETKVATSIATSTPTVVATLVGTATATTLTVAEPTPTVSVVSVATNTATQTATTPSVTTVPIATVTATSTVAVTTVVATSTPTVVVTATATASSTATASTVSPATIDLSWVYAAVGTKLCLNAAYFAGGTKAVLLIWTGPGADATQGSVTVQSTNGFCWDFINRQKGLYAFWADEPDASCGADICPRDAIPGNGAQYMTAPKATATARKWLHCETTGCDGAAYWDGTTLTPAGD